MRRVLMFPECHRATALHSGSLNLWWPTKGNSMTRNLKALGLTVVAVLAISAMVASAAQADQFTTSVYPSNIKGAQTTTHSFVIGGNRTLTCDEAIFSGALSEASSSITINATYGSAGTACHVILLENTFDATVIMNSCDFLLTEPTAAETKGTMHILCSTPGNSIEIHVYNGHNVAHTEANQICRYSIAPQTPGGSLQYTNTATVPKTVTKHAALSGIALTRKFGTLAACGAASLTATYSGDTLLKAFNEEGTQINLDVG
jgi:hypothetical protein